MAYKHVHVDILLKPFRFWCQKVLPLVYDDSLSYYEVLCKLTKYINELIENMKAISDAFDAIQDEFDDMKEQFDAIVEYYEGIQALIEGFRLELDALSDDYSDFKELVTGQIATITEQISNIPIITVDSELSSTSTNPVQNKVITEALQGVTPMTIDSELSTSSTNPVQNKVITEAIQGITPMTVDDELSTVSTNPVQNKVITEALNDIPIIEVDDAMSSVSENPVQNKVINSALSGVAQSLGTEITNTKDRVTQLEKEYNTIKRLGTFSFETVNGVTTGGGVITRTVASLPDDFISNNTLNVNDYDIFIITQYPHVGSSQPSLFTAGASGPNVITTSAGIYTLVFPYSCNCSSPNLLVKIHVFYARHVT